MTPPSATRSYTGHRRVRLGDADSTGRLRFDALTRYTQDVSDDDTTDAGLGQALGWVVRRTAIEVIAEAVLGEELTITTTCTGLGKRWAERRLEVRGADGAAYDVTTLWICVDRQSGRPRPLTEQFLEIYGPAAAGRTVSARLTLPKEPPAGAPRWAWPIRVVDVDTLGHVNNASYWAVVEEELAVRPVAGGSPGRYHAVVEYREGIAPDAEVAVAIADDEAGTRSLWWLVGSGVAAAASISWPV